MKSIRVVAAIIKSTNETGEPVIFATQRGYGDYKDWWEFPGGKIEPGEAPEEALVREIREELDAAITVDRYLITVEYNYPAFHLSMDCFWCSLKDGHITLLEHEAAKWLPLNDLRQVDWLPADVIVVEAIEAERENSLAKNKEVIVEETTIMSTISLAEFTKNCGTKKSYVKKWLDGHLIPGVTLAPSLEDTLFPRSARRPYRFRAKIKPTTTAKDIRTHIVNACIRREHEPRLRGGLEVLSEPGAPLEAVGEEEGGGSVHGGPHLSVPLIAPSTAPSAAVFIILITNFLKSSKRRPL